VDLILTSTPISTVVFSCSQPLSLCIYVYIRHWRAVNKVRSMTCIKTNSSWKRHKDTQSAGDSGLWVGKLERGKGGQRTVKYGQVIAVRMSWRYKEVQRRYKREECASKYVCLYKKKLWIGQRREVNKRNEVVGSSGFLLIAQLGMRL